MNAIVVASSPSWWLIDVAAAASAKLAITGNGTIVVADMLSPCPLAESRAPGSATAEADAALAATAPAAFAAPGTATRLAGT